MTTTKDSKKITNKLHIKKILKCKIILDNWEKYYYNVVKLHHILNNKVLQHN